jgi:hypothetical protein
VSNSPQLHLTSYDRAELLAKIRMACRYIKDDRTIAAFLGATVEEVQAERAKLARPVPAIDEKAPSDEAHRMWRTAAELSNKRMVRALLQYGLKRDSDLGMGAQAFMTRAREVGLVAL